MFASLYNDRAIAYRVHHGFDHHDVALSAGVQRMVRSDVGASGVLFTVDTESGFDRAVFITSSYGLGEAVVQGAVNPDEFYVYKPALRAGRPAILKRSVGEKAVKMVYAHGRHVGGSTVFTDVAAADRARFSITDAEVEELARQALIIEEHYGRPMDIEWGKDGVDGELYILQARPETVVSRVDGNVMRRFVLEETGVVAAEGRAIGQKIGAGPVRVMKSIAQMDQFQAGDVLVADMTDPDWEPIMKLASAIVTNRGGRTCHAAIIARELGIPAVVGSGDATRVLANGQEVTVSCAEGDTGFVYQGILKFEEVVTQLDAMPESPVKIMLNVGTPDQAFSFSKLPNRGVGLARLEFVINRQIGIHPRALLEFDTLASPLRERDRRADQRLRVAAGVLRQARRGGRLDARRRVRARTGDRAAVGLQVQRVRQPHRRRAVRAARGEPDDRLPRRIPVHLGGLPCVLRHGVRGAAVRPRRDGAHEHRHHGAVRPHPRRSRRRHRPARRERSPPRRERAARRS